MIFERYKPLKYGEWKYYVFKGHPHKRISLFCYYVHSTSIGECVYIKKGEMFAMRKHSPKDWYAQIKIIRDDYNASYFYGKHVWVKPFHSDKSYRPATKTEIENSKLTQAMVEAQI